MKKETTRFVEAIMQTEPLDIEENLELALNDFIYRRTSPYFPNEPYILLGEYLTMNCPGCLFVGFRVEKEKDYNEEDIYIGISGEDRESSQEGLRIVMDNPQPNEFSVGLGFLNDVKEGEPSPDLRKQFSDNSIELSQEARIIKRYDVFIIADEVQNKYYAFKICDNEINIYKVIKANFYRHDNFVSYKDIPLDYSKFEDAIEKIKKERYWINEFVKDEIERQFDDYAKRLEKQIKKIVLFCSLDKGDCDSIGKVTEYLPKAIVDTFPIIQRRPNSDFHEKALPIDDIDTMRWFTSRFEEGWHLQPNEQVGFLVLDTSSYSQSDSETSSRAGEKLKFKGWLDYKYTGNLFLNSPLVLQDFLKRMDKKLSNRSYGTPESNTKVDEDLATARDIVTEFLKKRFRELGKNATENPKKQLEKLKTTPTGDLEKELKNLEEELEDSKEQLKNLERNEMAFLNERLNELKEKVNAIRIEGKEKLLQALDGSLGGLKALDTMRKHLFEAVDKVVDDLCEGKYDSGLIKPILSANFENVKCNDENKIRDLVRLAKTWAEKRNNESEDITFPETITDYHIHALFYINLFMRRVLLEIPQSLEIGFAPYFMEIGFADPELLKDVMNFPPRRDSDIHEETGILGEKDAVYKLLGVIEWLFGIGGEQGGWTSYMPSAPLYGHGQRRGFIFVVGYYHRDWLKDSNEQLNSRLKYLSRLLRVNADYAGKELQAAYDRRFQLDLSSHIRSTAGDFQKGFQDNMYRLFNLRGRGSIEKIDQAEVKNDIHELLIHLLDGDNLPSQWRLHTPLLEGENKTFLRSGRFHLLCTLDNAFTFKAIADSIRTTVRKHGTRAAASALMGRNLSHNIGAHALYWLEKEQGDPELALFNAYLRERMDFVAAISTYMPLWITSIKMGKIVKDIRENHLLLKNIAKSERVFGVEVDYQGEDCSVAIPGGILGIQAFNAIIENIIRDGAKYGSRQSSECKGSNQSIQFAVKVSELQESDFATTEEKVKTDLKRNFVKVVITDSQSSYADTITTIKDALDDIEKNGLCDKKGQLLPNNWGIKERWIAASFLRGEQVEEKLVEGRLGNKQEALRILDILPDNGQLGWVFYLMKPQEVLVIKDDATQLDVPTERRDKVVLENWDWLKSHVNSS